MKGIFNVHHKLRKLSVLCMQIFRGILLVIGLFTRTSLGKSVDTTRKRALKLVTLPNLKVIRVKRAKIELRFYSCENLPT